MSVDAILEQAEALSLEEQAELVRRLSERLAEAGHAPGLTDAQRAELQRRIAYADANPGAGIPWEVVKAEARKRAGR